MRGSNLRRAPHQQQSGGGGGNGLNVRILLCRSVLALAGIGLALKISKWESHSIELAAAEQLHKREDTNHLRSFEKQVEEAQDGVQTSDESQNSQDLEIAEEPTDEDPETGDDDGAADDDENGEEAAPAFGREDGDEDGNTDGDDGAGDDDEDLNDTEESQEGDDETGGEDDDGSSANGSETAVEGQFAAGEEVATVQTVETEANATHTSHVKPQRVALLGERNTGTRWMSALLAECFPTLEVTPQLVRWKHWFQHDLPPADGSAAHPPTLVVSQFRNVYDWMEAMRAVPHHAPMHVKKEWREFANIPWTMPKRPERDAPFETNLATTMNETTGKPVEPLCEDRFYYNQRMSCVEGSRNDTSYLEYNCDPDKYYSCHKPIYELKHNIDATKATGEAYGSILEMRRDKIINMVTEIAEFDWIPKVIVVRYEQMLAEGTESLMQQVEEVTGAQRVCDPPGRQERKKRYIDPELKQWLNDHVDWTTENLIGYEKDEETANGTKSEGGTLVVADKADEESKSERSNAKSLKSREAEKADNSTVTENVDVKVDETPKSGGDEGEDKERTDDDGGGPGEVEDEEGEDDQDEAEEAE